MTAIIQDNDGNNIGTADLPDTRAFPLLIRVKRTDVKQREPEVYQQTVRGTYIPLDPNTVPTVFIRGLA